MEIKENHIDSTVSHQASTGGDAPEPEKPDDDEKKNNMQVAPISVHAISKESRKKQEDFIKMYDEIRVKIEKEYGKGNGGYEVYDNLYELMPERTPIDAATTENVKYLVDRLVDVIDFLYKNKPY